MHARLLSILSLAALLWFANGWTATAPNAITAHVTITAKTGKPSIITAEYVLSHPVTKLEFSRIAPGLRAHMWRMQTPDLKIEKDAIVSHDSKPFSQFSMDVLPDTRLQTLNYVPVSVFSDGSVALFTGYYNIKGKPQFTIFSFKSPDQPVIAYGKRVTKQQQLSPGHDGTYVYFGAIKPVTTAYSVLLLDPGLPAWINTSLRMEVPDILEFYTDEYATHLPQRLFVLFNWIDSRNPNNQDLQGDSLDGNISFVLSGAMWRNKTPDTASRLAKLIAHELAHQWNAALFTPVNFASNGGSWLAEGQAEFSANETANRFGWLSSEALLRNYTTDVNDCLSVTDKRPIDAQMENSAAIYGCGVTFNLLAQAALQRANPKGTFFNLWQWIYQTASHHHDQYSDKDFVDILQHLSGDKRLADLVDKLATKSTFGKNQMIIAALQRLDIRFTKITSTNRDTDIGESVTQPLFTAIMKTDCHGSFSFNTMNNGYQVDPLKRCAVFNKAYIITAINNEPLFTHGVAAYQAVITECAHQQSIRLTAKGLASPLSVKCPTEIPPMPDMIELTKLPWLESRPAYLNGRAE